MSDSITQTQTSIHSHTINNKLAIPINSHSYYQPDPNTYYNYNYNYSYIHDNKQSASKSSRSYSSPSSPSPSMSSESKEPSLTISTKETASTTSNDSSVDTTLTTSLRSSIYSPDHSNSTNTTLYQRESAEIISTTQYTPIKQHTSSKMSYNYNNKIGTVVLSPPDINNMPTTPSIIHSSPVSKLHLLDPIDEKSPMDFDLNTELPISASASTTFTRGPKNRMVLLKIIDMLTGKDKVGKVIQYALKITLYYVANARKSATLSQYNLNDINFNNSKTSNILISLLKRPELLLILLLGQFEKKADGAVKGLSMYRQMMRAGKTPFRVLDLFGKVRESVSIFTTENQKLSTKLQTFQSKWINEKTFSDISSLYYSFFDESLLMYKLGVLSSTKYRPIAARHEMLAWYVLIINGLRVEFQKLGKLNNQESTIKINYQVKQRAKALMSSMNIGGSPVSSPNRFSLQSPNPNSKRLSVSANTTSMAYELNKIKKEKYLVKLEIVKLLFDFIYDSINIFKIKMHTPLVDSFQFAAAFISTYKIWMKVREDMISDMKSSA